MKVKALLITLLALLVCGEARAARPIPVMADTNGILISPTNIWALDTNRISSLTATNTPDGSSTFAILGPNGAMYQTTIAQAVGAASGEDNTASNLEPSQGTTQGLFSAKNGVDLEFRAIGVAGSLTVHSNESIVILSNAAAGSGTILHGTNYGSGIAVLASNQTTVIEFNTLDPEHFSSNNFLISIKNGAVLQGVILSNSPIAYDLLVTNELVASNVVVTYITASGYIIPQYVTDDRLALFAPSTKMLTNHPSINMALLDDLANITSDVQAQLDAKQPGSSILTNLAVTGAITNQLQTNVLYVDGLTGNDATAQINREDLPFKSLSEAASNVVNNSTIFVRGGTYIETPAHLTSAGYTGTMPAPIKFDRKTNVTVIGYGAIIDGENTLGEFINIRNSDNIRFYGLTLMSTNALRGGVGPEPFQLINTNWAAINFYETNTTFVFEDMSLLYHPRQGICHLFGQRTTTNVVINRLFAYNIGSTNVLGVVPATFDGAVVSGIGTDWTIQNSFVKNALRAFEPEGSVANTSSGLRIINNRMYEIWREAIPFLSSAYSDVIIQNNVIEMLTNAPVAGVSRAISIVTGCSDLTIQNNLFRNGGSINEYLVYLGASGTNIIVENNTFENSHGGGILLHAADSNHRRSVIRNNVFKNMASRGMLIRANDLKIEGNTFYGVGTNFSREPILIQDGSTNILISGNFFDTYPSSPASGYAVNFQGTGVDKIMIYDNYLSPDMDNGIVNAAAGTRVDIRELTFGVTNITGTTTPTFNWRGPRVATLLLSGATTLSFGNSPTRATEHPHMLLYVQNPSSDTITWPSSIIWGGSAAPNIPNASTQLVRIDWNGTYFMGSLLSSTNGGGGGGGVTDHGALTGLTDDDHPQYPLSTDTLLSVVFANGSSGGAGATNLNFVNGTNTLVELFNSGGSNMVKINVTAASGEANVLVDADTTNTTTTFGLASSKSGSDLLVKVLVEGDLITLDNTDTTITINVTEASIDHGSIAGLTDDDHPQYSVSSEATRSLVYSNGIAVGSLGATNLNFVQGTNTLVEVVNAGGSNIVKINYVVDTSRVATNSGTAHNVTLRQTVTIPTIGLLDEGSSVYRLDGSNGISFYTNIVGDVTINLTNIHQNVLYRLQVDSDGSNTVNFNIAGSSWTHNGGDEPTALAGGTTIYNFYREPSGATNAFSSEDGIGQIAISTNTIAGFVGTATNLLLSVEGGLAIEATNVNGIVSIHIDASGVTGTGDGNTEYYFGDATARLAHETNTYIVGDAEITVAGVNSGSSNKFTLAIASAITRDTELSITNAYLSTNGGRVKNLQMYGSPTLTNNLGYAISQLSSNAAATNYIVNFSNAFQTIKPDSHVNIVHTTNRSTTHAFSTVYKIYAGNTNRLMSFNAGWKWLGTTNNPPTIMGSNTVGVLSLLVDGDSETNVVAAFAAE